MFLYPFLFNLRGRAGYRHPYTRALTVVGLYLDGTTHLLGQQLSDRQVEARANQFATRITCEVMIEDVGRYLFRKSRACVFNAYCQFATMILVTGCDRTVRGHQTGEIAQALDDHRHMTAVDIHHQLVVRLHDGKLNAGLDRRQAILAIALEGKGKIDSLLADVTEKSIVDYFTNLGAIDNETTQRENLFALIQNRYNAIKEVLDCPTPSDELLRKNIEGIKDLLDAIKDLQRFLKPLCGCGEELDKDEMFYSDFSPLHETLDDIISPLYNKVRG